MLNHHNFAHKQPWPPDCLTKNTLRERERKLFGDQPSSNNDDDDLLLILNNLILTKLKRVVVQQQHDRLNNLSSSSFWLLSFYNIDDGDDGRCRYPAYIHSKQIKNEIVGCDDVENSK